LVIIFLFSSLDHSTILYETPDGRPLLRVQWNKLDSNYLACFSLDAGQVMIIDARAASMPVATLDAGHKRVQAVRWAPHASNQIITCDRSMIRLWDIAQNASEPLWGNQTATTVQQIIWPVNYPDWLALGASEVIQVFQI
jgi:DDB1- and CUL4-associated factor 7